MNITIAGEGGQGVQTIAEILANAAFLSNLNVSYLPQFGVEQRGAPSVAFISVALKNQSTELKFDQSDIVVILRDRAIIEVKNQISPNTMVIYDSSTIKLSSLPKNTGNLIGFKATDISVERSLGKSYNILILGFISRFMPSLNRESLLDSVNKVLGDKINENSKIKNLNDTAFECGATAKVSEKNDRNTKYAIDLTDIKDSKNGKELLIIPSECKGCLICAYKCPVKAITVSDRFGYFGNLVPKVDLEQCTACGICNLFCPDTAIKITKK